MIDCQRLLTPGSKTTKNIHHKRSKVKDNLPWITSQIRRMIRKRDKLSFRKKQQIKVGANDLNRTTKQLKALKKVIQSEIRKAYWSYVESIITPIDDQDSQSGPPRFWTYIKHRRTDTVGIKSLCDKGEDVFKPVEIANLLNDNFQSIFTTETPVSSDLLNWPLPYSDMADIEITESGVLKLLQCLKIHKASGPDQIRPRVLKEMENQVAPMLTVIFKKSYDDGEVPEDWKTANITPVFKKGKRCDPTNYRPISLTV